MPNRFIALDPSSTATGWAVFEGETLVAWGTIEVEKLRFSERLLVIQTTLDTLADRYGFRGVAAEEIKYAWAGGGRQRNIAGLQVVFRVIKEWATGRRFPFQAYNVATWKNNIVGNVHASKEQTQENVILRIDHLPRGLSEHEYDAIAIGLNHAVVLENLEDLRRNPGPFVDALDRKDRLALAKTGIEALIDEATGYEDVRPPDELQKRLKKHRGEGGK